MRQAVKRVAVKVLLILAIVQILSNVAFGLCYRYNEVTDEAIFVCK